jgi:hypothetical protein
VYFFCMIKNRENDHGTEQHQPHPSLSHYISP